MAENSAEGDEAFDGFDLDDICAGEDPPVEDPPGITIEREPAMIEPGCATRCQI